MKPKVWGLWKKETETSEGMIRLRYGQDFGELHKYEALLSKARRLGAKFLKGSDQREPDHVHSAPEHDAKGPKETSPDELARKA